MLHANETNKPNEFAVFTKKNWVNNKKKKKKKPDMLFIGARFYYRIHTTKRCQTKDENRYMYYMYSTVQGSLPQFQNR